MRLRLEYLAALSLLAMAACAEMDQPASAGFDHHVSALTQDETGASFVVEVVFDDTLTIDDAMILLNNVAVSHDDGITLANPTPLIDPQDVAPESPHWNVADPTHGFHIMVTPAQVTQEIDNRRWKWVEVDVAQLVQHCPPGHGLGGPGVGPQQ